MSQGDYMNRTITLTEDEHLLGYKQDDQFIVEVGTPIPSGSLVVIKDEDKHYLCRYECFDGKRFLWPPRGFSTQDYYRIILGRAVEVTRYLKSF
jgi:hypothetical protein